MVDEEIEPGTLKAILEGINESIVIIGIDGTIQLANPSAQRMFELSSKPVGRKFFDLGIFDGETTSEIKELFFNRYNIKDDTPQEFRAAFRDGTVKWLRIDPTFIKDGKGNVISVAAVIEDITERKGYEQALIESETRFGTVVESLQEGLGITDASGNIVHANTSLSKLCGYGRKELIGMNLSDLIDGNGLELIKERGGHRKRGTSKVYESRITRKDGVIVEVMISIAPWTSETGEHLGSIGLLLDISERKKAEKALIDNEEKYRATVEQSAENIYIYDIETNTIVESNPAIQELLGYTPEEMRGLRPSDFIAHSEKNIQDQIDRVLKDGKAIVGERTYFRKDGSLVEVEVSAGHIKHGDRSMLCVVSRDVTEKKKARDLLIEERNRAEEERNRAEFYLDLLAHDIGNLHHGILTGIDMVQLSEANPERRERSLKLVKDLLLRSIKLVDNVMTFSSLRSLPLQKRPMDLRPMLEKSVASAREAMPAKELEHHIDWGSGDVRVLAEPLLQEAFFNIYHNAMKYQKEGVVQIETSVSVRDGNAVIQISDNGPGIPDDRKSTIFDRVKDPMKRLHTGLGMAIVKALVQRYDGSVQVADRIKGDHTKGSRFIISIPNSQE
ncbi:MAG: PAS domain S-box protein [Candidatus Thermoplasmatota archaeon]|nr:PAS domain S-box protein [Candidatus Thermoplasmatota archaeon]